MGKWYLKAATQRIVGLLPYRDVLHEGLQYFISRSIHLNMPAFEDHLRRDHLHIQNYNQFAMDSAPRPARAVFEVGTGWHPILPIAMWLCGVDRVWTCDVVSHLNSARVQDTVNHFIQCAESGRLAELLPDVLPDRLEKLRDMSKQPITDFHTYLGEMGIIPIVSDGVYSQVPDNSVDQVLSNVALEYVSDTVLPRMGAEFRRMMTAQGAMSHDIDMQDQYSYGDQSIPSLNFLKYSDRAWALINNPFIPLNRLRRSDYQRAFEQAGFDVQVHSEDICSLEDFKRVQLSQRFEAYDPDDVRVLRAWFVGTPVMRGHLQKQGLGLKHTVQSILIGCFGSVFELPSMVCGEYLLSVSC